MIIVKRYETGIRIGCLVGSSQTNNSVHLGQGLQTVISRIIGGIETQPLRYQYAVSLQNMSLGHQCGGSLIAPDMVLTAAHCQDFFNSAVIGRHDLSSNGGYNDTTFDHDLMLVLLEWPTAMDVPFVKLNDDTNDPRVGESVTVMGWGDMIANDFSDIPSDVLMSADIHVLSNQDCNVMYNGEITDNMVCATDKGQDSCHGDSGGPLVIQGIYGDGADTILVGVVSWGVGCGLPDFPGVYARISKSYSWIKNEVCNQSSNPPAYFLCGVTSSSDKWSSTPTSEDGEATEQSDESDYSIYDVVDSLDVAGGNTTTSSTTMLITEP
ncbi:hypothetical protein HJC23_013954 [Cyclotella cryptica]|uniref:Peptidase S1 domain-containing protein n=1 Tax=Cyclotella cryptica TaxID=29204 RepID=A0ABD3Q4M9_9STRA